MQVKQEKQEECYQVTFYFYVSDPINIEKDVSVNLSETKKNGKYFQIVVILNIFVCHFSASLTML